MGKGKQSKADTRADNKTKIYVALIGGAAAVLVAVIGVVSFGNGGDQRGDDTVNIGGDGEVVQGDHNRIERNTFQASPVLSKSEQKNLRRLLRSVTEHFEQKTWAKLIEQHLEPKGVKFQREDSSLSDEQLILETFGLRDEHTWVDSLQDIDNLAIVNTPDVVLPGGYVEITTEATLTNGGKREGTFTVGQKDGEFYVVVPVG